MADNILSELNTDHIKRQLQEFPDRIVSKKAEARLLREDAKDADRERAMLEAVMASEISDERNVDTGKPRFSNDKAREAELMKRKGESADYQSARLVARHAQFALSGVEDELEALADKFRAMRYVARLVSAELELLAGDDLDGEAGQGGSGDGENGGKYGMGRDSLAAGNQPY